MEETSTGFRLDFDNNFNNNLLDLPDFNLSGNDIASVANFQNYILQTKDDDPNPGNNPNHENSLIGEVRTIVKAYDTVFGRTPDLAGFDFWVRNFRNNRDSDNEIVDEVANFLIGGQGFSTSPEYQGLYPPGTTNGDFLTSLYTNQFNRAPDSAGFAFWKGLLDSGQLSREEVVSYFIMSDEYERQEGARIDQYVLDLVNETLPKFASGGDRTDYNVEIGFKDYATAQSGWTPDVQMEFIEAAQYVSDLIIGDKADIQISQADSIDDLRMEAEDSNAFLASYTPGSLEDIGLDTYLDNPFRSDLVASAPATDIFSNNLTSANSLNDERSGGDEENSAADQVVLRASLNEATDTGEREVEEVELVVRNAATLQEVIEYFENNIPFKDLGMPDGYFELGSLFHSSLMSQFSFFEYYEVAENDFEALKAAAPAELFEATDEQYASYLERTYGDGLDENGNPKVYSLMPYQVFSQSPTHYSYATSEDVMAVDEQDSVVLIGAVSDTSIDTYV